MSFKKISTSTERIDSFYPVKSSERKVGDSVTGTFVTIRDIKQKDGTMTAVYVIKTDEGKLVGVNSFPVIDSAFNQIAEGEKVRITFQGKKKSEKTGREYNDFSIEVDR